MKEKYSLKIAFKEIIRPRLKVLAVGLVLIFISKGASFVAPTAVKQMMDEVIPNGDIQLLTNLIVFVLAALIIQAITSFLLTKLVSIQAQYVISELRIQVQQKLLELPIHFFKENQSGALVSRVMNDVEGVRYLIGTGLVQLIGAIFTAIVAFSLLVSINIKLTLGCIIPMLIVGLISKKAFSKVRPIYKERRKIEANVSGRLTESISGIRVIKGFNAESYEKSIFEKGVQSLFGNIRKSMTFMAIIQSSSSIIIGIVTTTIMGVGGFLIMNEELSIGEFLQFTFLLGLMLTPIIQLTAIGSEITEAFAGLERTKELMETPSEEDLQKGKKVLTDIEGHLRFKQVDFSYEKDRPTLKNINFEVPPGKVTALVGSSGSGKSTIFALAAGFITADKGEVSIDGLDLNYLDLNAYRKYLGVVLQDEFLFDGSIEDNIKFANPNCSDAEFTNAIKVAYVDEFTNELSEGVQTKIGERGVKLSGGQQQRIAIARAILANPKILLLDEATSNLDSLSEHFIQEGLKKLTSGRTTLVIAHRLSTIKDAHQILVVDQGEIVERGTHEELLAQDGKYTELYTKQAKI